MIEAQVLPENVSVKLEGARFGSGINELYLSLNFQALILLATESCRCRRPHAVCRSILNPNRYESTLVNPGTPPASASHTAYVLLQTFECGMRVYICLVFMPVLMEAVRLLTAMWGVVALRLVVERETKERARERAGVSECIEATCQGTWWYC